MPRAFDVKVPVALHDPTRSDLNFNLGPKLDLEEMMLEWLESLFTEFLKWFKELTGLDLEAMAAEWIALCIKIISTPFVQSVSLLGDDEETLVGQLFAGVQRVFDAFFGFLKGIPVIGMGITELIEIIESVTGLIANSPFVQIIRDLVDDTGVFIFDIINGFLSFFDCIFGFLGDLDDPVALFNRFRDLVDRIWRIITGELEAVGKTLIAVFEAIVDQVECVIEFITGGEFDFGGILAWAGETIDSVWNLLTGGNDIGKALMPVVDEAVGWLETVNNLVGQALSDVVAFFENLFDREAFLSMFGSVIDFFTGLELPEFTIEALVDAISQAANSFTLGILPLEEVSKFFWDNLIQPVISVLTGDAFKVDLGALGVWASNLLGRNDKIPAQNLIGQISTALFGTIPLSSIADTQPNLLTEGDFDTAESVAAAGNWSWDGSRTYTGTGGSLKLVLNGTVQQFFSTQSIPVASGDKINLSGWVQTSGYAGSGTPISLALIPFEGVVQQAAVQIGECGASVSWANISDEYTVPPGTTSVRVRVAATSAATAGTAWFDKVHVTKVGLLQQGWIDRLMDAWNNLWHGIFGGELPESKTVDDVYTAAASLSSTANTALTDAINSLTQLGTLIGKLLAGPSEVIGSIVDVVVDGAASMGQFLLNLWIAFTGGSGTTKTVAQVATAAGGVASVANTASTNADSALTQLGTLLWNLLNAPAAAIGSLVNVVIDGVATVGAFLTDLWVAFTGGSGSDKTVAQVASAATTVTSNANSGLSNANIANTGLQTTWDNLFDAFDGSSGATGKTATDVRNRGAAVRDSAITGASGAALANTGLQTTWNSVYDGLSGASGSTGKTAANVQSAASTVRSTATGAVTAASGAQGTANTAVSNASIADGKAVTADGKAVAAQNTANSGLSNANIANTGLQTTWDNLFDAFDGSSGATGKTATDVRNRGAAVRDSAITGASGAALANTGLQTTWNSVYDGLSGASGSTGKTAANVQSAASTVRSTATGAVTAASGAQGTANTAVSNASIADGKAVTADGKAVAAQNTANSAASAASTADGKAVTADGKAVTAQNAVTATNNAVYNAYYGSGGSGTSANVTTTIAAIKTKLTSGWTVLPITMSGDWTRPWTPGTVDEPKEFWVICVGSGSGGGKGMNTIGGASGGRGGVGGKWLAKQISPSDLTPKVYVTIGAGGAGSTGYPPAPASPGNGAESSFGSYCATTPGLDAAIASLVGYYNCDDSKPGSGGNGGGEAAGVYNGVAGGSTPLANGGAAINDSNGASGQSASLTGTNRAGGGGGGGGDGSWSGSGGHGGVGGHPGGGGGGGGGTWAGTPGNGGNGAAGCVILLWK